MLLDCCYFANQELDLQNPIKNGNNHQKLDVITDILHAFLCGKTVQSESDAELFKNNLAAYFRREPKLLHSIIQDIVQAEPRMRRVLFSAIADVHKVEEMTLRQNIALKFGGNVSDKKWKEHFSPLLQATVSLCVFCMYTNALPNICIIHTHSVRNEHLVD
tara:strand:+ start:414 stop:896 length:483 start_codon:yes stop_codon:yes gene_type:complete